jgi:hypothetical protein
MARLVFTNGHQNQIDIHVLRWAWTTCSKLRHHSRFQSEHHHNWEGLCDHLKSKRISGLDSCSFCISIPIVKLENHNLRGFQLLTGWERQSLRRSSSQTCMWSRSTGEHLKWEGEPMWSFKRIRESPRWALVTFASLLQFWNLKWQISWFIAIVNWMKRLPNWAGAAHSRATYIPYSSKGWSFCQKWHRGPNECEKSQHLQPKSFFSWLWRLPPNNILLINTHQEICWNPREIVARQKKKHKKLTLDATWQKMRIGNYLDMSKLVNLQSQGDWKLKAICNENYWQSSLSLQLETEIWAEFA